MKKGGEIKALRRGDYIDNNGGFCRKIVSVCAALRERGESG